MGDPCEAGAAKRAGTGRRPSAEDCPNESVAVACSICSNRMRPVLSERYTFEQILFLWNAPSTVVAEWIEGGGTELASVTTLFRCTNCGWGVFSPTWVGTSQFYDWVQQQSTTYYLGFKHEYAVALGLLEPEMEVLDVGCGRGAFLGLVGQAGGIARGVEHSGRARALALADGYDVVPNLNGDVRNRQGGYDVVTAFQVVEHVADPVGFVKQLLLAVKPGGCLVIAVPNDEGLMRFYVPCRTNVPPHHTTRWTERSLRLLAQRLEVQVRLVEKERLQSEHVGLLVWPLRHWMARTIGSEWLRGLLDFGARAGLRALSGLVRMLGIRQLPWVENGHSVIAVFEKPAESEQLAV